MRKFALTVLLLASVAAQSQAGTVLPPGFDTLFLHNQENTYDSSGNLITDPSATLAVGDTIRGILEIDSVNDPSHPTQLFGAFGLHVAAIQADPTPGISNRIYFDSDPGLQSWLNTAGGTSLVLPGGTIVALFDNDVNHAVYTASSTNDVTGAVSIPGLGGLTDFAAFGFTTPANYVPPSGTAPSDPTLAAGYWLSDSFLPSTSPPAIPVTGTHSAFGLMLLDWTGATLKPGITKPISQIQAAAIDTPLSTSADKYDLAGQTQLTRDLTHPNGFFDQSSDPANIDILPEPGAIVIWSLGALGLCVPAVRRRLKIGK